MGDSREGLKGQGASEVPVSLLEPPTVDTELLGLARPDY